MEYFVTGATGLVGTHVVERLVERGEDVVALTRDRENAAHLPDAVEVVEGDITDKESLRDPMAGADRVFHMAAWFFVGPGPREKRKAERINVEGTRNVLELVDELGVEKAVYTSTVGVYPAKSGERIDETTRPEPPTFSVYTRTKWEAHFEVARPMMDEGLPLVVVQPGTVYGPHDKLYGSARAGFRDYLTGDMPVVPKRFAVPFDYAVDTADAHLRAMDRGTVGEDYIVASEPRTMDEVLSTAEEITGIAGPRSVPDGVFGALSRVMRVVERVTTPPEGLEAESLAFFAGRQYRVDNSKASRELGIEHRPLAEGLRAYLAWEMDRMGIDRTFEPPEDADRPAAARSSASSP